MRVDVIFVVAKQHLLEKEDVVSFNQKTGTGRFYDSKKFALLVLDENFLENIKKFTFNDYRTGQGVHLLPYQIHALQARMQLG